jgi:hypothetical protein
MPQRSLLIGLVTLLCCGCGSSPEETKKSLQGTWIAGAYLDSLERTGSPLLAARTLSGISDFHYDPARDSAVFGFDAARTVGGKGLTVLEDGRLQFTGGGLTLTFEGPRGADRMRIGTADLRRISRVADMTVSEYLVRRLFAGSYRLLEPPDTGGGGVVTVSHGGAVDGLGDIVSMNPVADYRRPFPGEDAVMLETLFQPDTLYYAWRISGDTLRARWIHLPDGIAHRPPDIPGPSFTLLRQNK